MMVPLCGFAIDDTKLNPYSRSVYQQLKAKDAEMTERVKAITLRSEQDKAEAVQAFVKYNNEEHLQRLIGMGVEVGATGNGYASVNIPLNILDDVIDDEGVESLTFARQMRKKNDVARSATKVGMVHTGSGLESNYTGQGVIYGTVDVGIDFNHYAFRNEDGSSRMIYAYLPDVSSAKTGGIKYQGWHVNSLGQWTDVGDFPGYAYPTDAIKNLTTDNSLESHGTHTIGIAAGGKAGSNTYYGMAPEADIIACGSSLTDASIVNGVALAMQEAVRREQPCVVNLSLGSNTGPHDGSEGINQILQALTDKGRIVVVSAGNEGDMYIYARKPADTQEGIFALMCADKYTTLKSGELDLWGRNGKDFEVSVGIWNKSLKKMVTTLKTVKASGEPSVSVSNSTYYTGEVDLFGGYDKTAGKYNVTAKLPGTVTMKNTDYVLCVIVSGSEDVEGWTNAGNLEIAHQLRGTLKGSPDGSYNDMAVGPDLISVGAYVSRKDYPSIVGKTYGYSYGTLNDIVPFSSYGVAPTGQSLPTVTAPGFFLISSISSYCSDYASSGDFYNELVSNTKKGGREQRYGLMYGTSMSAPCMAGIIALWLQANPNLTPANVREVMAQTSANDSYTTKSPVKFGYGKADALAGIKYVLSTVPVEELDDEADTKPLVNYLTGGTLEVTLPQTAHNARVEVYSLSGTLLAHSKANPGSTCTIQLGKESLGSIHVVRVISGKTSYQQKFMAR